MLVTAEKTLVINFADKNHMLNLFNEITAITQICNLLKFVKIYFLKNGESTQETFKR